MLCVAIIDVSNAWGDGFDMSGFDDEGWGFVGDLNLSGTLQYGGPHIIAFASFGYANHDEMSFNYFLEDDDPSGDDYDTLLIEDIIYYDNDVPVLSMLDVNIFTTIADLNSPLLSVKYNQGNDEFYGNDFNDIIKAGDGADFVVGYAGDDLLYGNAGDDSLIGNAGNDTLFGGSGYDTAAYGGASSDYSFSKNADGTFTVVDLTGTFGHDILAEIEAVSFDNGTFTPSSLLPPPPPPPNPFTGDGGPNTITGTSGNNTLRGFGGNDVLEGLGGNDFLHGGAGNDRLYGNSGKDAFVFDTNPHKSANKDVIQDFSIRDDTIRLENAIFTKVGKGGAVLSSSMFWANNTGKAHDKSDRIIYDKDSGVLYYDADGSGKGAAVAFASISKNLVMTYKDFYVV
jgi:Ca2+-binding RTX toxin-like protein